MAKKQTPTQTVRRFCKDCCGGILSEVRTCKGNKSIMGGLHTCCPFYKYRFGKGRISVKVIRQHCVKICMNGSKAAVRECPSTQCALYSFRLGTNPNYGKKDRKLKSKVAKKLGLAKLGLESKQKG